MMINPKIIFIKTLSVICVLAQTIGAADDKKNEASDLLEMPKSEFRGKEEDQALKISNIPSQTSQPENPKEEDWGIVLKPYVDPVLERELRKIPKQQKPKASVPPTPHNSPNMSPKEPPSDGKPNFRLPG